MLESFSKTKLTKKFYDNMLEEEFLVLKSFGFTSEQQEQYVERAKENIKKLKSTQHFSKSMYLAGFIENETIPAILNELMNWKPYILHTDKSFPFICSDNPGYSVDYQNKIFNTEFNEVEMFIFPLSSLSCLMFQKSNQSFQTSNNIIAITHNKIREHIVLMINRGSYSNSNKYILCNKLNMIERVKLT